MKVFTLSLTLLALLASATAFADDPVVIKLPFVSTNSHDGKTTDFVNSLAKDPKASAELAGGYLTLSYTDASGVERRLIAPYHVMTFPFEDPCTTTYFTIFEGAAISREEIQANYQVISETPECVAKRKRDSANVLSLSVFDLNQDNDNVKIMTITLFADRDYLPETKLERQPGLFERMYENLKSRFKK